MNFITKRCCELFVVAILVAPVLARGDSIVAKFDSGVEAIDQTSGFLAQTNLYQNDFTFLGSMPGEPDSFTSNATSVKAFRTIFYYGWAVFYVGKYPNAKQTLFISTLRSAGCNIRYKSSWQGMIATRFLEHVKGYYKSKLGTYHSRARGNSIGGVWRFDNGNVISGTRARQVRRYTYVENISDFVYYCK